MINAIGTGWVRHRRYHQKTHQFRYPLFMMHVDLDQLNDTFSSHWFWSVNKSNLAAFHASDYLPEKKENLATHIKNRVYLETGDVIDQVYALTHFRYFGYLFNPISLFFGLTNGVFTHCLIEVTNTPWKNRHSYLVTPITIKDHIYQFSFKKELAVSPFMTKDYDYDMRCRYDKDKLIVHIKNMKNGQCHFDATLSLNLKPITSRRLAAALLRHPCMTAKVTFGIYWQAFRLWCKRIRFIGQAK